MRTPTERLAEIHKRADARIAANQQRHRAIAGACTTLAMCLVIGLGVYRMLSVPDTPSLIPPEQTTICNTTTATAPTNTTLSVVTSTSAESTATSTSFPTVTDNSIPISTTAVVIIPPADSTATSTFLPSATDDAIHTVTTEKTVVSFSCADTASTSAPLPSATDDTIHTTVTATKTANVTSAADSGTTSLLSTTALPISATMTTTQAVGTRTSVTASATRTTLQAVTTNRFTTTVTVPTTFTTKAPVGSLTTTTTKPSTAGSGDGEPSHDDLTTLTTDTITVPLTTTTDDRTLAGDGVIAPQEPTTTTGNWGWDDTPPIQTPTVIPDVIFSTGSAEDVKVGDIITVDVTVSDGHFMVYGCIDLFFDPNALELLPVSDNPDSPYVNNVNMDIMPENCTWEFSTPSPGTLEFVFLSSAFCGSAQGGTMFTLTFRVLEGIGESTDFQWYIPFMLSGIAFDGTPNDYDTPYRFESGIISTQKD